MRRIAAVILFLAGVLSCRTPEPDVDEFPAPQIVGLSAERGEDYSQVVLTCLLSSAQGVRDCGFYFGGEEMEKIPSQSLSLRENKFTLTLSGLAYSSEYRYRAFIDGGRGEVVSEAETWRTEDEVPPVPEIQKIVPALGSEAGRLTLSCVVKDLSMVVGKDALECGVCYGPEGSSPDINGAHASGKVGPDGFYSVYLTDLVKSANYCFRPYAKIGPEVSYGKEQNQKIPSGAAVVQTIGCSDISQSSARLEGLLNPEAGEAICAFELNGTMIMSTAPDSEGHFYLTKSDLAVDTEYSFRAVAKVGEMTYMGETLSFRTDPLSGAEVGYVDLGLSVLWSTCNLGAESPGDLGSKYAWGETDPGIINSWQYYKWCLGTAETIFKYTLSKDTSQADNKLTLDPEDDAAQVLLGGKWRMPLADEIKELVANSTVSSTTLDGIAGFLFTSAVSGFTDQSLFLPFPNWDDTFYWTSELSLWSSTTAKQLYCGFANNEPHSNTFFSIRGYYDGPWAEDLKAMQRCRPCYIRPVRER